MKQIFRIYFKAEDTRPFLVLICLLIGGVAEAASISTLLPAITSIAGGDVAGSSYLNAQMVMRNYFAVMTINCVVQL